MKTKSWAIVLMVICTLFTSFAQIFYKKGAQNLSFNLSSLVTNWYIITGLALYGVASILFITALRGGQVTTLFPIVATSYVWVALGSQFFFTEQVSVTRWIGIVCIMIGIIFVNIPGKKKKNRSINTGVRA